MDKTRTWIVVADGSRARCFTMKADRSLVEFESLVSPEHRLHEADLTSDRAGRTFDSRGSGRHAMEPRHTAINQEVLSFSNRLADRIEQSRIAGEIDRLVLVAPPKFLGQLRSSLSNASAKLVVLSIDKEMATATADELAAMMPRFF